MLNFDEQIMKRTRRIQKHPASAPRELSDFAFWIEFLGGLGVWGLAEFRLWQILGKTLGDFNSNLTRPAPQAGCGG